MSLNTPRSRSRTKKAPLNASYVEQTPKGSRRYVLAQEHVAEIPEGVLLVAQQRFPRQQFLLVARATEQSLPGIEFSDRRDGVERRLAGKSSVHAALRSFYYRVQEHVGQAVDHDKAPDTTTGIASLGSASVPLIVSGRDRAQRDNSLYLEIRLSNDSQYPEEEQAGLFTMRYWLPASSESGGRPVLQVIAASLDSEPHMLEGQLQYVRTQLDRYREAGSSPYLLSNAGLPCDLSTPLWVLPESSAAPYVLRIEPVETSLDTARQKVRTFAEQILRQDRPCAAAGDEPAGGLLYALHTRRRTPLRDSLPPQLDLDQLGELGDSAKEIALATLVAEELLLERFNSENPREFTESTSDLFAAALSVLGFRAHCNPDGEVTEFTQVRIRALIREWIKMPRDASTRLNPLGNIFEANFLDVLPPRDASHHVYTSRLVQLIASAPWIRWIVGSKWPIKVELPLTALGDAALSLPPDRVLIRNHYGKPTRDLRTDGLTRLHDHQVQVTDFEPLAEENDTPRRILEVASLVLQGQLGHARRATDGLTDPAVKEAATRLLERGDLRSRATLADLRVVIDPTPAGIRALLINRNREALLTVSAGTPQREVALDAFQDIEEVVRQTDGSFGNARAFSHLALLDDESSSLTFTVGDQSAALAVSKRHDRQPPNGDGGALDPELFVGRANALEVIASQITSEASRRPVVISGNRRAGKTTLARHSLTSGLGEDSWVFIDVSRSVGSVRDLKTGHCDIERVASKISEVLLARVNGLLSTRGDESMPSSSITESQPRETLDGIDDFIESKQLAPIGLLLDEFDSLLYERDPSMRRLVESLVTARWDNIAIIATVQRHVHEFREWRVVVCPSLVSVGAALDYWAPHMRATWDDPSPTSHAPIAKRIYLDSETLFEELLPRVSTRVSLWGVVNQHLRATCLSTGSFIPTREEVRDAIDEAVRAADQFSLLRESTGDLSGYTEEEMRRRDLYSHDEIGVLANFLDSDQVFYRTLDEAGQQAAGSLREREILRLVEGKDPRLVPEGSAWIQYLRDNHEFRRFTR